MVYCLTLFEYLISTHPPKFFQLLDYQKEGNIKDLDIVKDEIVHRIQIQKRRNEVENIKKNLRQNYNIQTDLSKLTPQ